MGSTLENLRTVTEGESKEFSTMYPRMIRDAQDEGRKGAADSFSLAMDWERHHLEVFTSAPGQLESHRITSLAQPTPVQPKFESPQIQDQTEFAPVAIADLDTFVSAAIELDREI